MTGGLYGSLLTQAHTIDPAKWAKAREGIELVGQCRRPRCDGYLVVDDPDLYEGINMRGFHHARCLKCHQEVISPAGRVLRRSALASEQPRK